MKKLVWIAVIFLISCGSEQPQLIRKQLDGMEEAWRIGDKLGVAQFYSDDGYLISDGEIRAHGRQEIDEYWEGFTRKPVNWILTDHLTSQNLDEITRSEKWKVSGLSIPDWEDLNVNIPNESYYQLGTSDLIWETNGIQDTGTVDFFLVWKKVEDAYLIYVDAYK